MNFYRVIRFIKDMRYWPRQFAQGVKNLITWFPIIWLDKQWDHMYFLKMLEKKLKLMENYFENGSIIVDTKKVAKDIRIARILIQRLKKDEYGDVLHDQLDKKWGKGKFNFIDLDDKKDGFCKLDITYEKVKTKKDEEQHTKEMKRIWEHENLLRKQDKEHFAKVFVKTLDTWWE